MASSKSTSRALNRLTAAEVKGATLNENQRTRKLSDGAGLTLVLRSCSTGISKYWQLRFSDPVSGKEQTASLGTFPSVSLADARTAADAVRSDLRQGITPKDRERLERQAIECAREAEGRTFQTVAKSWYDECVDDGIWTSAKYQTLIWESLERHVFPFIGARPINEIRGPEIRDLVRRIGKAGTWETCQRVLQRINMVGAWAEDEEILEEPLPSGSAQRWISKSRPEETRERHYPSLDASQLPELLLALHEDRDFLDRQTFLAIWLQGLTAVRTTELRTAEWGHLDLAASMWEIPAERMKMKRPHLVPLSKPALDVIEELADINGNRRWLFPGKYSPRKCMSEATVANAIKRLGGGQFKGRMVPHGFRSMFSTWANEYRLNGARPFAGDVTERQLAHIEPNKVRRAYDKAQHLKARVRLMEAWGSFWLSCADSEGTVVSLQEARRD